MSYINNIKKNKDESIIIEKYNAGNLIVKKNSLTTHDKESNIITICFLDLETTGFDTETNEAIEIAMKLVEFNKETGELIKAVAEYESYNDPKMIIEEKITKLTGIDNKMVENKCIEWDKVGELLTYSQLVVAHNAKFDRSFIEKYIKPRNIWACSQKDINWEDRGFFKNNLEILCIWHGFYYGAHRAMNDVNATINLIAHENYRNNKPIIELIDNAKKLEYKIINKFPYDKEAVKLIKKRSKNYTYDGDNKTWSIVLSDQESLEEEQEWLAENIYKGEFKGIVKILSPYERYKNEEKA